MSLGRGAARDGRILKSRAELAFSWNTGIVKIAEEEEGMKVKLSTVNAKSVRQVLQSSNGDFSKWLDFP